MYLYSLYHTFLKKSITAKIYFHPQNLHKLKHGGLHMKDEMIIDGVRYIVTTHFDETASETVEDKMVRVAVDRIKESVNGLVRQDNTHDL